MDKETDMTKDVRLRLLAYMGLGDTLFPPSLPSPHPQMLRLCQLKGIVLLFPHC